MEFLVVNKIEQKVHVFNQSEPSEPRFNQKVNSTELDTQYLSFDLKCFDIIKIYIKRKRMKKYKLYFIYLIQTHLKSYRLT